MAYTGRLRPKGVPFFGLQVYERVGISQVELYRRVEGTVIWVCERAQKGLTDEFNGFIKSENVLFL